MESEITINSEKRSLPLLKYDVVYTYEDFR